MRNKSNWNLAEIAALLAILFVVSTLILAEEYNFTGTWKEWSADTGRNELGVGCTAGCGLKTLRVASVNKEKGSAKGKYGSGRWADKPGLVPPHNVRYATLRLASPKTDAYSAYT